MLAGDFGSVSKCCESLSLFKSVKQFWFRFPIKYSLCSADVKISRHIIASHWRRHVHYAFVIIWLSFSRKQSGPSWDRTECNMSTYPHVSLRSVFTIFSNTASGLIPAYPDKTGVLHWTCIVRKQFLRGLGSGGNPVGPTGPAK